MIRFTCDKCGLLTDARHECKGKRAQAKLPEPKPARIEAAIRAQASAQLLPEGRRCSDPECWFRRDYEARKAKNTSKLRAWRARNGEPQ